mmetsp:Transcript_68291/g.213604  ORF Transcript_68291/g.213604 Transcript_68291/m.213604 type:complete len:378 (+) Transcript_68291:256-1389(+)
MLRHGLVVRHVQGLVVLKRERLLHCRPPLGVEGEHLFDRIDAARGGRGVDRVPGLLRADGGLLDETPRGAARGQPPQVILGGRADDLEDLLDLVEVVLASENRPPADELAEDAPDRPHVDGLCVLRRQEHHLWRAVPAGHDVVRERGVLLVVPEAACQAEVADLEVAVLVHQDVRGLQVAVDHVGAVEVEEAAEDLVGEVLMVLVVQHLLGVDDLVEVRLHEVRDDVDVVKIGVVWRVHVQDANDVVVLEVPQELDLAQDPLAVHEVAEGVRNLLHRQFLTLLRVRERADRAIGAGANLLDELQVGRDLELHLPIDQQLLPRILTHLGPGGGAAPPESTRPGRSGAQDPEVAALAAVVLQQSNGSAAGNEHSPPSRA